MTDGGQSVRAQAHPNIALVKYWGKQTTGDNLPAVPSLSITLDQLAAQTTVSLAQHDIFVLDGQERSGANEDLKLARFMAYLRTKFDVPPLRIDSHNNFPTAAGLASSAAGFAALIVAINDFLGLDISAAEQSSIARVGSASAARSVLGGFVGLRHPSFSAEQIASEADWPLRIVIAITDHTAKAVSSADGMAISAKTSPYYPTWLDSAEPDFAKAHQAIADHDFAALAAVSEHSCLKMHALMLSSVPSLVYWNGATLSSLQVLRQLQNEACQVFFTSDAGPQVKAICTPQYADQVQQELQSVPGVKEVHNVGIGGPARVLN